MGKNFLLGTTQGRRYLKHFYKIQKSRHSKASNLAADLDSISWSWRLHESATRQLLPNRFSKSLQSSITLLLIRRDRTDRLFTSLRLETSYDELIAPSGIGLLLISLYDPYSAQHFGKERVKGEGRKKGDKEGAIEGENKDSHVHNFHKYNARGTLIGKGTRNSSSIEQGMILGSRQFFRIEYCTYTFKPKIVTELRRRCASVALLLCFSVSLFTLSSVCKLLLLSI